MLMQAYEAQLQQNLDLHKHGNQYDRLYAIILIGNLQSKIKKLARHVEPKHKLHLEPLSTFSDLKEGEQLID